MILKNGNVVTPGGVLHGADVRTEGGTITEIAKNLSGDGDVFDASGLFVLPGLIDIHTHGGGGGDFMDGEDGAFDAALRFHSQSGTTSILASSVTAPPERITAMLARTRTYMHRDDTPCRVLGAHVEGPYISLQNKGAQKAEELRVPARDSYAFLLENRDVVKNVTIASELDGAVEMAKELRRAGIVVSCGHDWGTADSIYALTDAGMTNCTHWYCAMSTARVENARRTAGLVEIGLIDDRLTLELLADNHHLSPDLVRLAYRCKGAKGLCVVSDCLRAGGMPEDGKLYTLGSEDDAEAVRFVVADGVARLPDGSRFAGSIQPIGRMLKNLVEDCGIPLLDAVRMASLTPAEIIGVSGELGSLEIGKRADIYIADRELLPVRTMLDGKFVCGGHAA